jgi:phosphoserine phosphatase
MASDRDKRIIIERILSNGWRAVVFDIDGTLLPRISANHLIFTELGKANAIKAHERDYANGAVDNDVVATALAIHFAERGTHELTKALSHDHFITDAMDVCQALRKAGLSVLVATVTWRFVADWVASQLGGEAISGVELEEREGKLTGKVIRHAYDRDKTRALQKWCSAHGTTMQQCIAIGDSRSDLDIFSNVGLALAINPSDEARAASDYAGDFETLWHLLGAAPLDRPTTIQRA